MRNEMISLHRETDSLLQREGISLGMTYLEGHDIHTFLLLLNNPSRLIHLQGYPGLSTPDQAVIMGRLMDTQKWLQSRQDKLGSIGNEHIAEITDRPLRFNLEVPGYNAETLADVIKASLKAYELPII